MHTINIILEDKDFERLVQAKGKKQSWREFILQLAPDEEQHKGNNDGKKD